MDWYTTLLVYFVCLAIIYRPRPPLGPCPPLMVVRVVGTILQGGKRNCDWASPETGMNIAYQSIPLQIKGLFRIHNIVT